MEGKMRMKGNKEKKAKGVRFPLGIKLAFIMGTIVLSSLITVTYLNSHFIGKDVKITAENNNLSVNSRAASTVDNTLNTIRSNVFQLLDLIGVVTGGRNSALAKQAEAFFFERNQDIASIYIISADSIEHRKSTDTIISNGQFYIANELNLSVMDDFLSANSEAVKRSCSGETIALNASPFFNIPVMSLMFPYREDGREQSCIITFSIDSIADIIGAKSENTTFIINDKDELLCHPDVEKILVGESYKNYPLVKEMRRKNENNNDSLQIPFVCEEDGSQVNYYGAYEKISFGDIVIMTTVPLDTVIEAVNTTRRNNLFLTAAVFFISTIVILCFTRWSISVQLRKLSYAADEIQKGNFDSDNVFEQLNIKRQDEIGVLNRSTKAELGFLNIFSKFTNKGVAKAIARNEIDFEPHLKDLTIFFSDIRGFTKISDGFKNKFGNDSPKEIIGFLNDYMGRMVDCITLSGGNVDKFEGDAIMAVWGILRDDSLEYESMPEGSQERIEKERIHLQHVKEDAVNACKGSIAMRYSLMKYNKDAAEFTEEHSNEESAKYKPNIKIGCGLNTGRVTAGIMGSKDKMEYTAIGDAVNLASRTEASNKKCGTDILIAQDTYELLKKDYIRCGENGFTILPENECNEIVVEMIPVNLNVKGKGVQHFYGVVNMPNFNIESFFRQGDPDFVVDEDCAKAVGPGGPKTLNEVRELLGIESPDYEKVNLNEEENKIQVEQ